MIVTQLIEKAMKKAQGAHAWLNQSESTDVSFETNRLKSVESSQRTGLGIKVILDGKVGSSNTTDIKDIDGVVDRALESAEFGSPAHFDFPVPQEATDVKVYDENTGKTKHEDIIKLLEDGGFNLIFDWRAPKSRTGRSRARRNIPWSEKYDQLVEKDIKKNLEGYAKAEKAGIYIVASPLPHITVGFNAEKYLRKDWDLVKEKLPGVVEKYDQQGEGQVDGPNEGRIHDQPGGDGELVEAPADGHRGDQILGPAFGAPPDAFLLLGHAPSQLHPLILR